MTTESNPLTPRENELVAELLKGKSNTEIAVTLNISETTVKNHLTNIMKKTGHKNRTAIALWAERQAQAANRKQLETLNIHLHNIEGCTHPQSGTPVPPTTFSWVTSARAIVLNMLTGGACNA